jgi:hypothetical protein
MNSAELLKMQLWESYLNGRNDEREYNGFCRLEENSRVAEWKTEFDRWFQKTKESFQPSLCKC